MSDADRVTRVAADLFEAAAAEGARQSRSAKQQLDHSSNPTRNGRPPNRPKSAPRLPAATTTSGRSGR